MTITQKWWSLLFASLGLVYSYSATNAYQSGETLRMFLKGAIALILFVHAFRTYKQTWVIEKTDRIFTIQKNGETLFKGRRMDLVHHTSHFGNYILNPLKGRAIRIPKKAANEALLELISTEKSTAPNIDG